MARTAAEWVLRLQQGVTAEEEAQFAAWLQEDPRHAEVFAEMDETAGLLDKLLLPAAPMVVPNARPRRYWWLAVPGLAAAVLVLGFIFWWQPYHAPFAESAATEVGALRRLELPDGSVVHLNTASAVDVRYSGSERRVRLSAGEAFFEVAKNRIRPFYVEAGGVTVRAVGTAFNVRLNFSDVTVVVTEGKVRVDEAQGPVPVLPRVSRPDDLFLVAGERAVIPRLVAEVAPAAPQVVAVAADDLARTVAWTEHRLQFSGTPLPEILAEFNRYNQRQLVLGDPGSRFAPLRRLLQPHGLPRLP
ncbi:MAG: FecR domain-containing protein [Opitutaceae bacterium]|nr:FecR domain-containing protein [Opitutaceae bacterium]